MCSTIELSRIIPFFFLSRLPSSSSSPLPHTYDTPTDSSARASHVPSKLHTRNFQPTLSLHLCLSPSPWSCPRPISCGQLHTLLYFHLCPIHLVLFKGSYFLRMGYLILRGASRLDAFSVYPFQTWLPGCGVSTPTGTPAVRPSRSSRTKDSSSQISSACAG